MIAHFQLGVMIPLIDLSRISDSDVVMSNYESFSHILLGYFDSARIDMYESTNFFLNFPLFFFCLLKLYPIILLCMLTCGINPTCVTFK